MGVYENILVPLDGSEFSESVLPEVERLANTLNSHITILRITHADSLSEMDSLEQLVFGEALDYVNKIKGQLRDKGLSVESDVASGPNTVKRILGYAAENDIGLIMMSTHGYTGAKHLLFGSLVEEVVRHTEKPVLLVHAK